jgi:hypothetical protein
MISERTAIHTPTHRPTIRRPGGRPSAAQDDPVECPGIGSTGSRKRPPIISMTIALWRALARWGSPSFFEFERRAPEHRRLGPGVSRVSDSFWPLSEW